MSITRDKVSGFIFLIFCLTYSVYAHDISMLPGEEYEPINAQTLPKILGYLGAALSGLFIIISHIKETTKPSPLPMTATIPMQIKPVICLLATMVFYGAVLDWIGFIIATVLFLILSFRIMGEKRPKRLFGISIGFVLVVWGLLTQLLDIYLAPGKLFLSLGGA